MSQTDGRALHTGGSFWYRKERLKSHTAFFFRVKRNSLPLHTRTYLCVYGFMTLLVSQAIQCEMTARVMKN